jgi:hypothetical protein
MPFDSKYLISKVNFICLCFVYDGSFVFLARRLEREVKEILDDFSSDETLKSNLLKGKRVDLAEELSKIFSFKQSSISSFL